MIRAAFATIALAIGIIVGVFTFDGAPSTPTGYPSVPSLDGWDIQVHDRDAAQHPGVIAGMMAQHGVDCSAPPATHDTGTSVSNAVFQCANHIMTAINSDSYGVVYLTPPQMVDFSTQGVVSFDLSTEKHSHRDWWDVTVSPFMDSQALPLQSDLSQGVDLQAQNRNSIVVTTDNLDGAPHAVRVTNGFAENVAGPYIPANSGIAAGTNQAATRQPFKLTLSKTHIRFERLASATGEAIVFVDADIPALTWTQGVIQLGHHSYVPTKCDPSVPCSPGTWHWDNVVASPGIPFYIQRVAQQNTGGFLTTQPAPAGAFLRFSAICRPVIDGVMPPKMTDTGHPEHFSSYLVPIAQGSTSHTVGFVGDDWYDVGQGCLAKDISVFAQDGSIPSPTASPSATPTPSPSPSPSPTASPTPTPTPSTYRCQVRNANGTYSNVWVKVGGGQCP